MDFPAIALLTQMGIPPLVIFVSWLQWQSYKSDKEIKQQVYQLNKEVKMTLSEHDKRLFELELRRQIKAEQDT